METIAREKYLEVLTEQGHINVNVRACGLFVHPEYIFMGASPDAIVSCDCCGKGVFEIKCSSGLSHLDPAVFLPAYMRKDHSGNVTLNRNHEYCSQVAMHMAVTGSEWCDFFVFSIHGFCMERISRTEVASLIEEIEKSSEAVFHRYILPRLVSLSIGEESFTKQF